MRELDPVECLILTIGGIILCAVIIAMLLASNSSPAPSIPDSSSTPSHTYSISGTLTLWFGQAEGLPFAATFTNSTKSEQVYFNAAYYNLLSPYWHHRVLVNYTSSTLGSNYEYGAHLVSIQDLSAVSKRQPNPR